MKYLEMLTSDVLLANAAQHSHITSRRHRRRGTRSDGQIEPLVCAIALCGVRSRPSPYRGLRGPAEVLSRRRARRLTIIDHALNHGVLWDFLWRPASRFAAEIRIAITSRVPCTWDGDP